MKKLVVVGASSVIAQNCARQLITEEDFDVVLVGRNEDLLNDIAQDLAVRSRKSNFNCTVCQFDSFADSESIAKLVNQICLGGVPNLVLIAHGSSLAENDYLRKNPDKLKESLCLNGVSPVLFAECFAGYMEVSKQGQIAIIGSVAGDRGRASNYIYGSGKSMVEAYCSGLNHYFATHKLDLCVTLVKPGPTLTPMTAHMDAKSLADPVVVAKQIIKAIRNKRQEVYVPHIWRWIMLIIRNLPLFVFNRLKI